jgi:2-aminoethylphosphonate-pyruvate transaminase
LLDAKRQILFTPGPVNLDPAVTDIPLAGELCHREPEFEALRERVVAHLHAAAVLAPAEHRLSLLHGSGTLAVDAALASLVRGRALVVDNGVYCRRLVATLEGSPWATPTVHVAGLGMRPDLGVLERQVADERPDWIAMVHHETTTGLLNPVADVADLAERHGARLFVDAVSSFPVHPIDPRADVVCFDSDECLEALPGIAGVFWRGDLTPRPPVPVLDVAAYVDGVPGTPNVPAFVALDAALDLLMAEDREARYARLAHRVWEAGGAHFEPLLPEADRSHVLTAFRVAGGRTSEDLLRRAREHGYVIQPGEGPLRDGTFRVANLGTAIDERVIDDLFAVLARAEA